jgi:hypothetical protein
VLRVASGQRWGGGGGPGGGPGAAPLPAHADFLASRAPSPRHPADAAAAADAAERCWGQRRAKVGWQLLQRLLAKLDGPRWNYALTTAAAAAAVDASGGRPGGLPLWVHARCLGDARANPKGLPTAAYRAAGNRRAHLAARPAEASGAGGGALGGGGDPTRLLRTYLKAGLLSDAVDLATTLVVGGRVVAAAAAGATWADADTLLPERGDAVWLPYSTFDQVLEVAWGVLEQQTVGGGFPGLEAKVLRLEASLKAHFRKLITQEAFLDSTRAIAQGGAH